MKVLIIRFSSIGDIVLTTPVVRCVKQQTGAEVHFLTKRRFVATLAANPYVDRLWTIDKSISEIAPALLDEGFDHVLDLHRNLRTTELRLRLTAYSARHLYFDYARQPRPRPRWHAFAKLNAEKYLLVNFGLDRLPDTHIVDRYLATARDLGVTNDGAGLDYFIPPGEAIDPVREQLPANFIAFVIGAAHPTKCLTESQMTALCAALPHPVYLVGGPAENAQGERVAAGFEHVVNTCGRYSLGGSADLIRRATVVVTHDTGMMHIAAAFRKPIISIWGNTVPEFGMYPYLPGNEDIEKTRRQEVRGLSCRPCSKIGHRKCPKGHFRCIRDQEPSAIARRAAAIFSLKTTGG